MIFKGSQCILSSGKILYVNGGILGMSEDLELSQGYDGLVENEPLGKVFFEDSEAAPLTADERAEIADYMIDLWQKWRGCER